MFIVLASIAFVYTNALVRVPPETLCRKRKEGLMRNRDLQFNLRMSEDDFRRLDALSHASGLSFSAVIRNLLMNAEIKQRPDVDFRSLARAVDRIGNNYNQLTRKANTSGIVKNEDLAESTRLLREIRHEIESWKQQWL